MMIPSSLEQEKAMAGMFLSPFACTIWTKNKKGNWDSCFLVYRITILGINRLSRSLFSLSWAVLRNDVAVDVKCD